MGSWKRICLVGLKIIIVVVKLDGFISMKFGWCVIALLQIKCTK